MDTQLQKVELALRTAGMLVFNVRNHSGYSAGLSNAWQYSSRLRREVMVEAGALDGLGVPIVPPFNALPDRAIL